MFRTWISKRIAELLHKKHKAHSHIWLPAVSASADVLPFEAHVTDDKRMSVDIMLEENTRAADLDLPADQRHAGVGTSIAFWAFRNLAVLQGELAHKRCLVQEDGRYKVGLVQQPIAILKLKMHRGDGKMFDLE